MRDQWVRQVAREACWNRCRQALAGSRGRLRARPPAQQWGRSPWPEAKQRAWVQASRTTVEAAEATTRSTTARASLTMAEEMAGAAAAAPARGRRGSGAAEKLAGGVSSDLRCTRTGRHASRAGRGQREDCPCQQGPKPSHPRALSTELVKAAESALAIAAPTSPPAGAGLGEAPAGVGLVAFAGAGEAAPAAAGSWVGGAACFRRRDESGAAAGAGMGTVFLKQLYRRTKRAKGLSFRPAEPRRLVCSDCSPQATVLHLRSPRRRALA